MKKLKTKWLSNKTIILIFTIIIVFAMPIALANESNGISNTKLGKDEVIDGIGFFYGDNVVIEGKVNGTTIVFAQRVFVDGTIDGDLFIAAQNISIDGKVSGNVYIAGQEVEVSTVANDIFLAGQDIIVNKEAKVERDLLAASNTITNAGEIGRNFNASAGKVIINGRVGNEVNLRTDEIYLQSRASIEGDFNYTGKNQAKIDKQAKIIGDTKWKFYDGKEENIIKKDFNRSYTIRMNKTQSIIFNFISSILAYLLVWFIIIKIRKNFFQRTVATLTEKPVKIMGIGLLSLIVVPIISIIFMITIIGIPLGILLIMLYGISIYISGIIVAIYIGEKVMKDFEIFNRYRDLWVFIKGIVIIAILNRISFISVLVGLLVTIAGLGSIVVSLYKRD